MFSFTGFFEVIGNIIWFTDLDYCNDDGIDHRNVLINDEEIM